MADNVVADPGSGGATFTTSADSSGFETPHALAAFRSGGSAGSWNVQPVDLTHGLPTNFAFAGGSSFTLGQQLAAASLPVVLTAAQLTTLTPPTSVGITGSASVGVTNFPANQTVSGTVTANAGSGTFPVSQGGAPWSVSGTVTANQGGAPWSTTISGTPTFSVGSSTVPVSQTGSPWGVSGTVTANAGSGTFTVNPGNTQNTTAWLTSLGSATVPVNVVSGSTGNAAAGTTGSAVPAQAGYTGINVAGNLRGWTGLNPGGTTYIGQVDVASVGGTTFATTLPVTVGSATIPVNVVAGSSGNGAASATGSAVPAQADYGGLNVGGTLRGRTGINPAGTVYLAHTDITTMGGTSVSMNSGTTDAGTQRVIIASNDSVAVTLNPGGTVTANAGTGTFTVNPGNTANTTAWLVTNAAGSASIGAVTAFQGGSPWAASISGTPTVAVTASSGGGYTPFRYVGAGTTNTFTVKSSPGVLGSISGSTTSTTAVFLKLYNTGTPTVGTSVPVWTGIIPGNSSGAGTNPHFPAPGMVFTSGIGGAITGGCTDNDTTSVAANAAVVSGCFL